MHSKKTLGVFIAFILVFATFPVLLQPQMSTEALVKIDPNLLRQMENENGPFTVLVQVKWHPELEPIKFNHDAVIMELKSEAAETQAPVITYLKQKRDAEVLNTFWLSNLILIKADEGTIRELATLTTVEAVLMNFQLTVPVNEMGGEPTESSPVTWNIEKVRAPEVWEALNITGKGIKFATTDTGIEIDHPDLIGTLFTADPADPKYPGGWIEFDSAGNPIWSTPHDTYGHGTATYGLMVGDAAGPHGAVGMAPGAKGLGMHALTLPGGSGYWAQVIAGLQWVIDPYDEAGNHYPMARVSSHSWGAYGYHQVMIEPIRNMWFAGHFVVCAIGNGGECSTGSPGNVYEAVGAGATDIYDYVVGWSSGCWVQKAWWPAPPPEWPDEYIKPEVSAPGVNVIVPYWGKTWRYWSGTSFSSPHVGGAAVLMLSGNPTLTPPEIQAALEETAVWYNYYYDERPDTRYGWGRIDAYEAVMMVALPQGVRGYVTDAVTGLPISKVKVYAHEANRTVFTDENGYYDMRLLPGDYTLTFSRFGYYEQTESVTVVADVFTWLNKTMEPVPPGYIAAKVYFKPTNIGIPGALVKALTFNGTPIPVPVECETNATGVAVLTVPPGTYDLQASAYGFTSDLVKGVVVVEGETTKANFYLEQPLKVAVVGDYAHKITRFLTKQGYTVDEYGNIPAVTPHVAEYSTIVVNWPGYTSYGDFMGFIRATDANSIGVLWLDSWISYTGGYWLHSYLGWPPSRYTSYSPRIEHTFYRVTKTDDDIIPGWPVGYKIIHDYLGYWKDHAYYRGIVDGDIPDIGIVKTLTNVGKRWYGYDYDYPDSQGIVKVTRPNNKWMVLSMHANTPYIDVGYWHDDTKTVFLNSINWVAKPHVGIPKFVVWGLKAEPKVTVWKYPVTVSVGIKNVGWVTGTDTVKMYVDTILEGKTDVTLAPGEYTYPSWNVSRFEVGTYKVTVRHLTTSFRVRPPIIELQAYEFSTNLPLAGADVYGYYRKYMAPGWYEQWSKTYGGYGHSQHAQPIGDIDEDGINEIIIGGYEASPAWGRARIISYNASLGTYIEEYSWYVPGGFFHSPSGSTVLDLDEDGDLEFVVSWAYSGADGIYAYDWDGKTLTTLDYYPCGFVFDVYTCDYDDDGHLEVLIANAPWGGTPYHVMAFGWDKTTNKFVVEATWRLGAYTWECPMIWSGDIDGDGKTEVVACISDSYYSTAGTWALHWNSTLNKWEEQLVYSALIGGGTHYGVVVGDVNGNGIDEIGIGNNRGGYVGAGAVLIEWNGTAYEKVWEGSWPDEYCIIEALAIGDADNDGKNEFVAGGGYVHIISWTGTEYVEEATITKTAGLLSGVVIGDCDSDDKNEIKACDIIGLGPGKEWIFKYAEVPTPEPGWKFKYFGTTDADGKLVFDSPASVVDMILFVYKPEKTALGYQYLLEEDLYIDDDMTVTYTPHAETEAIIITKPNARSLELFQHVGIVWLQKDDLPILWPFTSYKTNPTKIVVTPKTYVFRHMLNMIDPYGSWWYYFMAPDRIATLNPGQTYSYQFAGSIQGYIKYTQTGPSVTVQWNATDNYGHQITGISLDEVSWLSSGTTSYTPVAIEPSMLEDVEAQVGESITYYPLIILYGAKKNIIVSGYVEWNEKTVQVTTTKLVESAVLSFMSGPYGNPHARMYVTVISNP